MLRGINLQRGREIETREREREKVERERGGVSDKRKR
jgi:hypothetical protein